MVHKRQKRRFLKHFDTVLFNLVNITASYAVVNNHPLREMLYLYQWKQLFTMIMILQFRSKKTNPQTFPTG